MKIAKFFIPLVLMLTGIVPVAGAVPKKFFLKSGDRVCFYGDSITEQRFYPTEVQTYVLTRFPGLRVRFVNSGVGGDTVTGGWAGTINERLKRDVFPFKPTVVTIMLGGNDAGYCPFSQKRFDVFKRGYEHIIKSLKAHLPGVRIVLLGSSPYDDVTQPVGFPGGCNGVILRFNKFTRQLAAKNNLLYVPINRPMTKVLKEAYKINPDLARKFFPGRIHPSPAAAMMQSLALLKAWGAPATVTDVSINATDAKVVDAVNTRITDLKSTAGTLSWTELDNSLPLPVLALHAKWPQFIRWNVLNIYQIPQPQPKYTSPVTALVDHLCGFTHQLDREIFTVNGLSASRYRLLIDGKSVGEFSAKQLAHGVNLSRYFTPMLWQAYRVNDMVWEETELRFVVWHGIQTAMENYGWPTLGLPVTTENDSKVAQLVHRIVDNTRRLQRAIAAREFAANQPKPHQFELVPVGQ